MTDSGGPSELHGQAGILHLGLPILTLFSITPHTVGLSILRKWNLDQTQSPRQIRRRKRRTTTATTPRHPHRNPIQTQMSLSRSLSGAGNQVGDLCSQVRLGKPVCVCLEVGIDFLHTSRCLRGGSSLPRRAVVSFAERGAVRGGWSRRACLSRELCPLSHPQVPSVIASYF